MTGSVAVGTAPDPDLADLGSSAPGFLLWRATLRWQRAAGAALDPLGLTHAQFALLAGVWFLGRSSGPPTQRELADHVGTEARMTSQVVQVLAANGLVTRGPDPADGRVRRLGVTRAGDELARRALGAILEVERAFFAATPPEAGLLAVLRPLAGLGGDVSS
ncbi:MAG: MarR family winged helix-turn-helix transcriptional regulator [Acidimicrobiales bacterium]